MHRLLLLLPPFVLACALPAADPTPSPVTKFLGQPIIGDRHSVHEVIEYCDAKVPEVPVPKDAAEWQKFADETREKTLQNVVFRGEAAKWKEWKPKVVKVGAVPTGMPYKLTKLRYEALPGVWVPALMYEPEKLEGKVPVVLNVNGHDSKGKAADYKQIRCINQALKGMIALNIEWLGMGQLRNEGFSHARMNQLDLCGTSGVAPFFFNMSRGLDVLLDHPNADPKRVAVTGLSGGGWQTIFISSLDTRVTLTNPVAGYSSFRTRARHPKDLGDSEQTPTDLAVYADYATLTAMMAPRPTLLTNNASDNCCFEAGYVLPPLLRAAGPAFAVFGKSDALRTHVNHDPGTHNYEKDNREAFYRMVADHFYAKDAAFDAKEIDCKSEIKTSNELNVELPEENKDFNQLARDIAATLPKTPAPPKDAEALAQWQKDLRGKLREVVRWQDYSVRAEPNGGDKVNDIQAVYRRMRVGDAWTVPCVEITRGKPKKTAILLADSGRKSASDEVEKLLSDGFRVLAIDPLGFGESQMLHQSGDAREPKFAVPYLYSLLLSTVGERLLGIEASQTAAIARWAKAEFGAPVHLISVGPRTSLIAMTAAAVEDEGIGSMEMTSPMESLKDVIEESRTYNSTPEAFCFGLLEIVDVPELKSLIGPRLITVSKK
jgi:dienelactone hydrolase